MTLFEVVILALVQGLTEFLPVSSSGHLLVARLLFGISDIDGTAFDAFLHLGTLGALVVYYWRVWWGLGSSLWRAGEETKDRRQLLGKLILASVPAALTGYFFQDYIEDLLRGPQVLALSFLFTALVLWWFDRRPEALLSKARVSWKDSLIIGLWQVVALVPAVSRSGVTIAGGRAQGLSRKQATIFSFLMSAPIIAGASLLSLTELVHAGSFSTPQLVMGTLVSFVSGLLAIYLLMKWVERMSFLPFAIYLVGLAIVVWVLT